MSAGSDYGNLPTTIEYYSPPYLFRGDRPVIHSAPSSADYGQSFSVVTPQAADISRVALVRAGATTHATNFEQRYLNLAFTRGSGALTVTAPRSAKRAPPGYYMLFLLDSRGVPAVASFIRLA